MRTPQSFGARGHEDGERGFSLIELVIVMGLLSLVLVATLGTLTSIQRSETYTRGRTAAMDNMRTSLNRISRDLRQATAVNGTPTASRIDVDTYVNGTPRQVVYDVTGGTITREVDGGGPVVMHQELTEDTIFSYTPPDAEQPDTVKIELKVKPSNLPDTTLTLNSEVELRNR
jgi:prepilin-type N-terminal cleavage/methylation domain-containing protein